MGLGHTVGRGGSDVGIVCHTGFDQDTQTTSCALSGHKCHSEAKSRSQVEFYLLFHFILVCLSVLLSGDGDKTGREYLSWFFPFSSVCCYIFLEVV